MASTSPCAHGVECTAPASCNMSDTLCWRIHALEPSLPLQQPLERQRRNACPLAASNRSCFPFVHVIGGYHSFLEETLGSGTGAHGMQPDGLLSGHAGTHMEHRCLNNGDRPTFDKSGGSAFLAGWTASATSTGEEPLLIAECMTGLMWYPNLAGRYAKQWEQSYWPCKAETIRGRGARAYHRELMWSKCRPEAMMAHDVAHGTGGPGHEATPPFVLRSLYPPTAVDRVRVVAVLRHPTDRLETSFWLHPHYGQRYGRSADGLHAYAAQHTAAFATCEAKINARRCAFFFENLDRANNKGTFFACDQVIRGIYWPFVAEWFAAFGEAGLLVLRAEALLDSPGEERLRVLSFLGLPPSPPPGSAIATPPSYAVMHAASLRSYDAEPMHDRTRLLLDSFYAPHTRRLLQLLGWPSDTWRASAAWPSGENASRNVRYQRYGPYNSHATRYQ